MTKCVLALLFFITAPVGLLAQLPDSIPEQEAARIIQVLASDSLKGRGNGQPALLQAGEFIGEEFRKNNLQPLPGFPHYFIPFFPLGGKAATDALIWNGEPVDDTSFLYLHSRPGPYSAKSLADFKVIRLTSFFTSELLQQQEPGKDLLIWTDQLQPGNASVFPTDFRVQKGLQQNILLVYARQPPDSIRLEALPAYATQEYNVVGILPGKSRANEVILFSAHYDHMGVLKGRRKDSIMNGANDNASGTTALLLLARYFAQRNDNERTLLFCAFAGEELGLKGSLDFVKYVNYDKIVAGINLEMLGVPQFGKKKVFITGEKYSSLPDILQKGLQENGVRTIDEPSEGKHLFMRSDNYAFVAKGVPAHTIMASDDDDHCYHRVCDEIKRIDIPNLTAIARAVAAAVAPLVSGQQTPERIDPSDLKQE